MTESTKAKLSANSAARTAWRNRDPIRRARAEIARSFKHRRKYRRWIFMSSTPRDQWTRDRRNDLWAHNNGRMVEARACWSILRRLSEKPIGWVTIGLSGHYRVPFYKSNAVEPAESDGGAP